ncbi:DUF3649 domain-containing protein [Algiphilus sp.]|uniref:DUF3649 domain-containing protein n=1 Tax=Algiphilus sp. TaxID=1872431 RepID=UPI0025C53A3E|nr:DUF3649 domain-containing protein [Algiphilus sp.]MCK5769887.1 DUF3649 domain-containing protein [Algiphilus sp.]
MSRIAAAALAGYALSHVGAILFAAALPVPRADGVLAAMMFSFAIYTGAIMWAFAASSAGRAWLGLLVPTLVLALPAWWVSAGAAA